MIHLKRFNESKSIDIISLEELENRYPQIKFTMDKKDRGYFVRADIIDQGGKSHYLGAYKGQVSYQQGLKFLSDIASSNYDKFY